MGVFFRVCNPKIDICQTKTYFSAFLSNDLASLPFVKMEALFFLSPILLPAEEWINIWKWLWINGVYEYNLQYMWCDVIKQTE